MILNRKHNLIPAGPYIPQRQEQAASMEIYRKYPTFFRPSDDDFRLPAWANDNVNWSLLQHESLSPAGLRQGRRLSICCACNQLPGVRYFRALGAPSLLVLRSIGLPIFAGQSSLGNLPPTISGIMACALGDSYGIISCRIPRLSGHWENLVRQLIGHRTFTPRVILLGVDCAICFNISGTTTPCFLS